MPVRPGAGIPALNEMKIMAIAITTKRINKMFFIMYYLMSKSDDLKFRLVQKIFFINSYGPSRGIL